MRVLDWARVGLCELVGALSIMTTEWVGPRGIWALEDLFLMSVLWLGLVSLLGVGGGATFCFPRIMNMGKYVRATCLSDFSLLLITIIVY